MQLSNLHKRIATAVVLVGIMAIIGWTDSFITMWFFLGLVYIVAFDEALRLMKIQKGKLHIVALLLWIGTFFYHESDDLIWLTLLVIAGAYAYNPHICYKQAFAFLYPGVGMFFLMRLYNEFGIEMMGWLLVIVATTDTFAYITGKMIGKTPFSATSPNKTLEGVAGGIFVGTIAGVFAGTMLLAWHQALIVSLGVAIASVFGDLFESFLKRQAGVKDSGNILPGHGGVLDRIDGYLFGAPIMTIILGIFL